MKRWLTNQLPWDHKTFIPIDSNNDKSHYKFRQLLPVWNNDYDIFKLQYHMCIA